MLLLDVPASLLLGGLNRRHEPGRAAPPAAGHGGRRLANLWLSGPAASRWPLALGLYVAAVGARALPQRRRPQPLAAPWGHAAGGAIGLVEMLFGTADAGGGLAGRRLPDVLALQANAHRHHHERLRRAADHGRGRAAVASSCGGAGCCLIVLAALGVLLGHHWARRVSAASLRKLICGLLVISRLSLVAHAVQLR